MELDIQRHLKSRESLQNGFLSLKENLFYWCIVCCRKSKGKLEVNCQTLDHHTWLFIQILHGDIQAKDNKNPAWVKGSLQKSPLR